MDHRSVQEPFIGGVLDAVMANYLIQGPPFLDCFLILLGAARASADTFEAQLGPSARALESKYARWHSR